MGSAKKRRMNVAPLAGGGSVVAGSGNVVVSCRFSGIAAAIAINGALGGDGELRRRDDGIVLTSGHGDIAELDRADPLFERLAHCLDQGADFLGVLQSDGGRTTVNVRPRS